MMENRNDLGPVASLALKAVKKGAKKAVGAAEDALFAGLGFPGAWIAKHALNYLIKFFWAGKITKSSATGRVYKATL